MAGGQQIDTGQGSLGLTVTVALNGQSIGVEQGNVFPEKSLALTGEAFAVEQGQLAVPAPTLVIQATEAADVASFVLENAAAEPPEPVVVGGPRPRRRQQQLDLQVIAFERPDVGSFVLEPFRSTLAGKLAQQRRNRQALALAMTARTLR